MLCLIVVGVWIHCASKTFVFVCKHKSWKNHIYLNKYIQMTTIMHSSPTLRHFLMGEGFFAFKHKNTTNALPIIGPILLFIRPTKKGGGEGSKMSMVLHFRKP